MTSVRSRRSTRWLLGLLILVQVAGVALGAWFWAEFRNTLERNGRWMATKERLEMDVMAARAYLTDRHALAYGQLDLSAWHGFQEVLWREPVAPRRIAFDFRLSDGSWLAFVFGHDGEEFAGLRISASPLFRSHFLKGLASGEFTVVEPVELPALDRADWIRLEAEFGDGRVAVRLNGAPLPPFACDLPPLGRFGFRSGQQPVFVDRVELETRDGHVVRETFTNVRDLRFALIVGLAAIVVLDLAILALVRLSTGLRRHGKKLGVSAVVTATVLIVAAVLLRDRFARSYWQPDLQKEEAWRRQETAQVVREVAGEHAAQEAGGGVTRVLVVGTSQTYGSGAARRSEGMVPTLERLLNADRSDPRTYEVINGSVSGSRSEQLLELYETTWSRLDPDAVVINLSNNDANRRKRFQESLEGFLALTAERGIPTLFVLEATSVERSVRGLPLHPVMRSVAKEHDVPLVDMHAWLRDHAQRGFQWWDVIHPTSYGHRLIAERLVDEVRALVGSGGS